MYRARPKPCGRRSLGFTLVELLVVIAIIALIVSLLAAVVPQIQRQARSGQCLSNQRQLNVAFTQYYGDNSEIGRAHV